LRKTDSLLFSGFAITACAHVVPLQAPIDAHAVTRWWLQFKDKGLVSLLVGLKKYLARLGVYTVTDKQHFGLSFTQFSCFDARLRIRIMTCTCNCFKALLGCTCIHSNPHVLDWIEMELSLIPLQSNSTYVD